MKTLYLDCFSGISGDMFLGAFVDAGLSVDVLKDELDKLALPGYGIRSSKVTRAGISGTKVEVTCEDKGAERKYSDIVKIITESRLADEVKESSLKLFGALASAEGKIHGMPVEEVHFHELGCVDSIIDMVGAAICFEKLGIKKVHTSRINVGNGTVKSSHGILPVPSPATAELLKGAPVFSSDAGRELVTPTGGVIISAFSDGYGELPEMRVLSVGYGAGTFDDPRMPNMLRIFLGEADDAAYGTEKTCLVETNIDDMNPEFFEHVSELLLKEGCQDVFMAPVYMKKNRPGTILSVLASREKLDRVLDIVFSETTTLGVRVKDIERRTLSRRTVTVNTKYGDIDVKIGSLGKVTKNIAPEIDVCRRIASEKNIPLKQVYEEAKYTALNDIGMVISRRSVTG